MPRDKNKRSRAANSGAGTAENDGKSFSTPFYHTSDLSVNQVMPFAAALADALAKRARIDAYLARDIASKGQNAPKRQFSRAGGTS